MKNASNILYSVGKAINVIEIVFGSIAVIFGVMVFVFGGQIIPDFPMLESMTTIATGTGLSVGGFTALVVSIVALVLANNATKSLTSGKAENAPHIVMIVVGVFTNFFYLLGGIFGLVAENTETDYSVR